MKLNTFTSEVVKMEALNNLFIEMTAKNCTKHCKMCYIDFPQFKKVQDFINIDIVKNALNDSTQEDIKCIYLTGAEPMEHPDFNAILRMCLRRSNVCICTNGSFINEKKARFLKKVEDESSNEIIFKLSLDHYDEMKNDDVRYRGAFRQTVFAVKHLIKYGFNPIITVTNYYNESEDELMKGFEQLFDKTDYEVNSFNIQINPWYNPKLKDENIILNSNTELDCMNGRILTVGGVYSCPFLANDYRGRCGANLRDFNRKSTLETGFCSVCLKAKSQMFGINFSKL